jgi:hypothetical protein
MAADYSETMHEAFYETVDRADDFGLKISTSVALRGMVFRCSLHDFCSQDKTGSG